MVLVDIFCRSTHPDAREGNRIYLLLQRLNVSANEDSEGYSCYNCQWLKVKQIYSRATSFGTRILHITEADASPGNHSSSPAQWRDVYISARPRHRAHLTSDISELVARLATNAPKFPSFRIQTSMISNARYYTCAATELPTSHPWMGYPPFNLVIKDNAPNRTCVLTLGVCRGSGVNKGIAAISNHISNTPHYYAVVRGTEKWEAEDEIIIKVSGGTYTPPEHDCRKDHISDGSTIRGKG